MFIHKASKECGLTKKAIVYYEEKGLIFPTILENGYRDYSEVDIRNLKEISVLRKCGISVSDIKDILINTNKSVALAKYRYVADMKMNKLKAIQECMDHLISNYDIEREFLYLQANDEALFTIKEKMAFAFPSNYGIFLSLHFGRFLEGAIDSEEKHKAYNEIINYLDELELNIPSELTDYLEENFPIKDGAGVAQFESTMNDTTFEILENTQQYLVQHKQELEECCAFLKSEEYLQSPTAIMQKKWRDFQSQSGYQEKLVENMKILSPSYTDYCKKFEIANEKFFSAFPYSRDIYGIN